MISTKRALENIRNFLFLAPEAVSFPTEPVLCLLDGLQAGLDVSALFLVGAGLWQRDDGGPMIFFKNHLSSLD